MPSTEEKSMDRMCLKGMKFEARHGVFDFEKDETQPFVVDLTLYLDLQKSSGSDDLRDTVDYSRLYTIVKGVMFEKSYNLIESLAGRIIEEIFKEFQEISRIEVTVHKPLAPIDGVFEDVCVSLEMEKCTNTI